jgi:hypothetical protein
VDGDGLLDIHLKYGSGSVVLDRKGRQLTTGSLYGDLDLIPVGDLDGVPGSEMVRQAGASVELLGVADGEDGSRQLQRSSR